MRSPSRSTARRWSGGGSLVSRAATAGAFVEAQRMVAEKLSVAAAASMTAAFAWPLGVEVATAKAASHYQKAVRANRRRLRGGA